MTTTTLVVVDVVVVAAIEEMPIAKKKKQPQRFADYFDYSDFECYCPATTAVSSFLVAIAAVAVVAEQIQR